MGEKFVTLDKFIRSKQMIVFFLLMTAISILFYPVLSLRRRRAMELQESIKLSNRGRLNGFGGTSLNGVK